MNNSSKMWGNKIVCFTGEETNLSTSKSVPETRSLIYSKELINRLKTLALTIIERVKNMYFYDDCALHDEKNGESSSTSELTKTIHQEQDVLKKSHENYK